MKHCGFPLKLFKKGISGTKKKKGEQCLEIKKVLYSHVINNKKTNENKKIIIKQMIINGIRNSSSKALHVYFLKKVSIYFYVLYCYLLGI